MSLVRRRWSSGSLHGKVMQALSGLLLCGSVQGSSRYMLLFTYSDGNGYKLHLGAVTATNRCVIRKGISSQYHPLDIMETGWKHWPRESKGLGNKFCSPKCINFTVINYSTTLNNICTIYYASLCYLLELMSYSTHILYEVCLR